MKTTGRCWGLKVQPEQRWEAVWCQKCVVAIAHRESRGEARRKALGLL